MVKFRFFAFILAFIVSCGQISNKPEQLNIGVWGNWSASEISKPIDYKSVMALTPLYYRYLFDKNPDYSILKNFEQRGDTVLYEVQDQLYWENGTLISSYDVIQFFKNLQKVQIEAIDVKGKRGSLRVSNSVPLNWYFHAEFSLDKAHGGNGLYKIDDSRKNALTLSLKDSTNNQYPRKFKYTFLGDKPEIAEIKSSKYDIIIQLPVSYYRELYKLPGYRLHKKERKNLALLLFNTDKISNYKYYREVLNQYIDRDVLTDAILWSYATAITGNENSNIKSDKKRSILPDEGRKRDIKILLNKNPTRIKVLQEISTQIPSSYFTIKPEVVNWQIFKERLRTKDFEALYLEWTFDSFLDIFEFWGSEDEFSAAALSGIKNERLKSELFRYREDWNESQKKHYFDQLSQKIYNTYPVVFLYTQNFLYLSKEKMKIDIAPDNWFKNLPDWQLEAKDE